MPQEIAHLPEVETSLEFKEKVEQTCQYWHLSYPAVVLCLLQQWIEGGITLETQPEVVGQESPLHAMERVKQFRQKLLARRGNKPLDIDIVAVMDTIRAERDAELFNRITAYAEL